MRTLLFCLCLVAVALFPTLPAQAGADGSAQESATQPPSAIIVDTPDADYKVAQEQDWSVDDSTVIESNYWKRHFTWLPVPSGWRIQPDWTKEQWQNHFRWPYQHREIPLFEEKEVMGS